MRRGFVRTMSTAAVISILGTGSAAAYPRSATGHLTVSGTFSGVRGSCELTGTASAQHTLGSLGTVQGSANTQCGFVAPELDVETTVREDSATANMSLATATGYTNCWHPYSSWAQCGTRCQPAASCAEFISVSPVTVGDYLVTHRFTLVGEDYAHRQDGEWISYPSSCTPGSYSAVLYCGIDLWVTVPTTLAP